MNRYLVALFLFLSGCAVRAGNPQPPPKGFEGLAGRIMTGDVKNEKPVAGAAVQMGGQKTVTDEHGFFNFKTITGNSEKLTVGIRHPGYAPAIRVYPRKQIRGRFVTIRARPVDAVKRIRVADGGVIVLPGEPGAGNEAAVRFPPKAIQSKAEFVDVALSIVRPLIDDERRAFPGEYVGKAETLRGGKDLLSTLGTVDISFYAGGQPLDDVVMSAPASMQLALDDKFAANFAEGDTVATWWLNTATGAWMGEGFATVGNQNGRKIASWPVNHFTWWNVDYPLITHACSAIRLVGTDADSKSELANLAYTIEGVDYAGASQWAIFDAGGLALGSGMRGHPVKPALRYLGVENEGFSQALLQAGVWKSGYTFALPDTNASSFYNKGPGGVALDPEKHCHYTSAPFTIRLSTVTGNVFDSYGQPLAGAVVVIPELGQTAVSAADGSFRMTKVPWKSDGSIVVSVTALPPAERGNLIFDTVTLKRDQADSVVTLIANVRQTPPAFTLARVSDSAPGIGSSIDFQVSVLAAGPALQWGLRLCGSDTVLAARVEVPPDGKIAVCHVPPGNPENAHTISIAEAAVQPHLEHGDDLGVCAGVDAAAPPKFADISPTGMDSAASCSSTLSDLNMVQSQVSNGFLFSLRGKWHGGDAQGPHEIGLAAKDFLGYETHSQLRANWRNNTPVIMLSGPSFAPIGNYVMFDSGAIDSDGDMLTVTWKLNGLAAGEGVRAEIGPMAPGTNIIDVSVTDGTYTVTQRRYVMATQGCQAANCSLQELSFVALLDSPPYAIESTRQALLASIIQEQFLSAKGTAKYNRYRNFMDLQLKRAWDADPASPLVYDRNSYQYQPASGGYEPMTIFDRTCMDIPLVGSVCMNASFFDSDGQIDEGLVEYEPSMGTYGIKVINAATGTYRIDVTAPVSIDMFFEPPVSDTVGLADLPNATVVDPRLDLSTYVKVLGRADTGPFRFRYLVTMPTDATATSTTLIFYPIQVGWDTLTTYDEFGNITSILVDGDFQFIWHEFGPFCNNNLRTTGTPAAGADYEADPEKRPFGNNGIANYPGLISDVTTSYNSLYMPPYPHASGSAAGGSGVGRDRIGLGSSPYAFSNALSEYSDNPNNCARPADACTSTNPLQDGGPEWPTASPSCELPNVSNNSDDATYKITQQFTSIIPYIQGEIKIRLQDMGWMYWEQ